MHHRIFDQINGFSYYTTQTHISVHTQALTYNIRFAGAHYCKHTGFDMHQHQIRRGTSLYTPKVLTTQDLRGHITVGFDIPQQIWLVGTRYCI